MRQDVFFAELFPEDPVFCQQTIDVLLLSKLIQPAWIRSKTALAAEGISYFSE
jgi:hypothetical protein